MAVDIADEEVLRRFPRTRIDHDNKDFYKGWLQRRLLLNRCRDCGHWHHPPRPLCPQCWSTNVDATEVGGRGRVHLLIRLHQGPEVEGVDYARRLAGRDDRAREAGGPQLYEHGRFHRLRA